MRYFLNEKEKKEYLISADFLKVVIVWDIDDDYNIIHKLDYKYKGSILSTLLLFNINNNNYIITSSDDANEDFSRVYSFNDGSFIKEIQKTNTNKTYYLLPWFYNEECYIIELCNEKISINALNKDENYAELILAPECDHYGGFIYNEKYLCCSGENGNIRLWDLVEKKLMKKIDIKGACIFEIIQWNQKFVVAANYTGKSLIVVDIEKGELVKQIKTSHKAGVRGVKKIFHSKFGECLITSAHDNAIRLWCI